MKKAEGFLYECQGFVPTEEPDPKRDAWAFQRYVSIFAEHYGGNTCGDTQCRQYPEPGDGASER